MRYDLVVHVCAPGLLDLCHENMCIYTEPASVFGVSQELKTYVASSNSLMMALYWNVDTSSDNHFVEITPPIESTSIFTTPNITIQLPVLYNQEYISVVANSSQYYCVCK